MFAICKKTLSIASLGTACAILVSCGSKQPLPIPQNLIVSSEQPHQRRGAPVAGPDVPPHIVQIWMSSLAIQPGSWLNGSIITTTNAASVEVRTAAFSINSTHVAPGEFRFHTLILDLPPLSRRHTYALSIIARNTAGVEQSEVAPLAIK